MKLKLTVLVACSLLLATTSTMADETLLLPLIVVDLQGLNGNRWSSELYLENPTADEVTVYFGRFFPGKRQPADPCPMAVTPFKVVPPRSSVLWSAGHVGLGLGCAEHAVGALNLVVTGPVRVSSRIVNHQGTASPEEGGTDLLAGFGQRIEAVPVADLPDTAYQLLPSLVWHRNACGPVAFDAYVGAVNPSNEPVQIILDVPPELGWTRLVLDGREVQLPFTLEIPPATWRHMHVEPTQSPLTVCMEPEIFALYVDTIGPAAIYGSVVDRRSQDPRTVEPLPRE
ncbi:MAG: hypothetical protein GY906_03360 [bacterium]|nr:hypothetical protein [bacterium]